MKDTSKIKWSAHTRAHFAAHARWMRQGNPEATAIAYARWLGEQRGLTVPRESGDVHDGSNRRNYVKGANARVNLTYNGLNGTRGGWARSVQWYVVERQRVDVARYDLQPYRKTKVRARWVEQDVERVLLEIEIPHSEFNPVARDDNPELKPVRLDGSVIEDAPGYLREATQGLVL